MAFITYNKDLPFIKTGWKGNELNSKGLYTNLHGDDIKTFGEVLRWMSGPHPLVNLKKGQQSPLSWQMIDNISGKRENAVIPLGHASFIIDLNGIRLVVDPVVVDNRFFKRYTQIPFHLPELNNVDYLLLSHNHRDHIDKSSVQRLCHFNPGAIILTGLGIGRVLRSWGIKNEIQEAGWYQRYQTSSKINIDYLPSHHWSRRWFRDTNKSLWGSFMIQDRISHKNIYFAGDSGMESHFQEIGEDYQIDLAMIGVGAYEPKWFMAPAHTGPLAAIQAFKDLKAKFWMPMHYGTFDLSDEPVYYPEKILREQNPEVLATIRWMDIGRRIEF